MHQYKHLLRSLLLRQKLHMRNRLKAATRTTRNVAKSAKVHRITNRRMNKIQKLLRLM